MFFFSQFFFFLYPGLKEPFGSYIVQTPHVYSVINHNLQICSHCLPKVSSPPSTTSVLCSQLCDSLTAQKSPWMMKKCSGGAPHLHACACADQGFPWMGAHGWAGCGAEDQPCCSFPGTGTGGPGGVKWDPGLWGGGGPQGAAVGKSDLLVPWGKSLPSSYMSLAGSGVGQGGGWASALARHSYSCLFVWTGLTLTLLLDTSAGPLQPQCLLSSLATLEHNAGFNTLYWGDLLQPAAHRQGIYGLLQNNLWLLKFSLKEPPGSRYHHLLFLSFAIIACFCHLESFRCLWLLSFFTPNKWICSVPAPSALGEQLSF